ncbi:MAG: PilZ domain-containing protein [Gammaproteobacteria bacterium]|nr:PilZ domain-containing protein [Gammaproteobacteria bacterium]
MDNGDDSQFGTGLVYEDCLPLGWREVKKDVLTAEILNACQSNERVLRGFSVLDEHRTEGQEDEHVHHGAHESFRLEFKINLLLDMVARLLAEHISIPVAVPVRMSGSGIGWRSPNVPPVGSTVSVDLYLNRLYPTPITFYGEVKSVVPDGEDFQVEMGYRDMSDSLRSWIEKLIFRHHRRQIAHSRQQGRA